MYERYTLLSVYLVLVLTGCSTHPSETPIGEQKSIRIPESITGNWVCGSRHSDEQKGRDTTISSDSQWLIGIDGRFHLAGRMDFIAPGEAFSVSIFGEGRTQMADGRAWIRYEDVIMLPVRDTLGTLAIEVLKDSLNQSYPVYETASYSVEGDYLTSVSEPSGIETECTRWEAWEILCKAQEKTICGARLDKVQLETIKQEFVQKQIILEAGLSRLPD